MKDKNSYKLIEGVFEPQEAQRILLDLINTKINYHNREAFSENIRFNKNSNLSNDRVQNLKSTADAIKDLILLAKSENYLLHIDGLITIDLIKNQDL